MGQVKSCCGCFFPLASSSDHQDYQKVPALQLVGFDGPEDDDASDFEDFGEWDDLESGAKTTASPSPPAGLRLTGLTPAKPQSRSQQRAHAVSPPPEPKKDLFADFDMAPTVQETKRRRVSVSKSQQRSANADPSHLYRMAADPATPVTGWGGDDLDDLGLEEEVQQEEVPSVFEIKPRDVKKGRARTTAKKGRPSEQRKTKAQGLAVKELADVDIAP